MVKRAFFVLFGCMIYFFTDCFAVNYESDTTVYDKVWVLERMNNRKVKYRTDEEKITLIITSENEYASGTSGCNTYVCQVVIKRSHMFFRQLGVTKMACPEENIQNERIYLNNLNDVDSFKIIDEDLYLYKNNRPILVYKKE